MASKVVVTSLRTGSSKVTLRKKPYVMELWSPLLNYGRCFGVIPVKPCDNSPYFTFCLRDGSFTLCIILIVLFLFTLSVSCLDFHGTLGQPAALVVESSHHIIYYSHCSLTVLFFIFRSRDLIPLFQQWISTEQSLSAYGIDRGISFPCAVIYIIGLLLLFLDNTLFVVSKVISDEPVSAKDALSDFAGSLDRYFANYSYLYGVVIVFGEILGELAWIVGDFCIALASIILHHYYERLNRCGHLIVNGSIQEMEEHCRCHFLVSHLVQKVHSFFSPLILITVGSDIIFILTALFCGLEADLASPKLFVRISFALTFSFLVLRVATSTYLAARVPEEAQKTIDYLLARRVFVEHGSVEHNRQQIVQLDLLFQQIQDEAVHLGGGGFFSFSKSYAAKLFSVVVTYEIIMLQFPH